MICQKSRGYVVGYTKGVAALVKLTSSGPLWNVAADLRGHVGLLSNQSPEDEVGHGRALTNTGRSGGGRMMTAIPILLYHSVSTDPAGWIAPYSVTPNSFAHHVDLITASGRTAMTVSDLSAALTGRRPLPHRPIVITFDDGFADFADAAVVLREHYLPSTLYVTSGALRGRGSRPSDMALPYAPMLDWSQLHELCELNVEIAAHGRTHRELDMMSSRAVADEIWRSKGMLDRSSPL